MELNRKRRTFGFYYKKKVKKFREIIKERFERDNKIIKPLVPTFSEDFTSIVQRIGF